MYVISNTEPNDVRITIGQLRTILRNKIEKKAINFLQTQYKMAKINELNYYYLVILANLSEIFLYNGAPYTVQVLLYLALNITVKGKTYIDLIS